MIRKSNKIKKGADQKSAPFRAVVGDMTTVIRSPDILLHHSLHHTNYLW